MNVSALERSLIDALYGGRLREALDDWLDKDGLTDRDRIRAQEISVGLARFDSALFKATEELRSDLTEVGPGVEVLLDRERLDGRLKVLVSRDNFGRTLDQLRLHGFVPMRTLGETADRAIRKAGLDINMIAPKGPLTSVSVTRRAQAPRIVSRMNPGMSDFQVSLPSWAWWAYWGVKPIRRVGRALGMLQRSAAAGPFLGTPEGMVSSLLELVGLSQDDLLIDIGCGDGRVLIEAVESFGCRGRGVEVDATLAALAKRKVSDAGLSRRVSIEHGDFAKARLDQADVVFAFLPVGHLGRIIEPVLNRMAPGARLVVHEQDEAHLNPEPDSSSLVVVDMGVTVAHTWTA